MRAMDVMTTDVITVDPDTTVQALATLLAERGISGAPVVDTNGRLVGIISEGDLLHRAEIGTARRHRDVVARSFRLRPRPRVRQITWPHHQGHHDA